ncbi:LacI family DNA-binding transcriptional regulator [Asinibacterium sp. OR53]|uniref:LacI family DNA-binding transcriptional regulator n=1 Tax=Asinibacterium sp. OR53 TaxID=925409 RepID=UPI00047B7C3F|nr:LacI family DNA-binding transcriptional regulator [Asinibacterium sp. OR53]
MNSTTIKQLAKELNLSVGSVSKALKDSHEISSETKQKVLALAAKYHYTPNPYASSLRKRKSKTIAVVLPEVADSFFSQAINGIESVAQAKGYHVLIYLSHEDFKREEQILSAFRSGRVDGILISVSEETSRVDHIKEVLAAGIPVVFFDRVFDDIEAAKISTNDFEGAYEATRCLLERGCKKISFLSIAANLSITSKRVQGFRKALQDAHIGATDADVLLCSNDMEQNCALIRQLLEQRDKPDGIIASVEKLVTPVYLVSKQLGVAIPDDLKIIGFTNLHSASILEPSLTTVTQPAFEIGKTAATVLFKGLEEKHFALSAQTITIPSMLVERASTRGRLLDSV